MMNKTNKIAENKRMKIQSEHENCVTKDEYHKEFGHRLQTIMERKNINLETLSEKTGISKTQLNRYKNGISLPSAYNVYKLVVSLECSVNELLGNKKLIV